MGPEEIARITKLAREAGILPMGDPADMAEMLNSSRPKIRLPGDNRELGQFATEIGEILAKKDVFRRDRTPVTVNAEKRRLDALTPDELRTWAEYHLVCFKDKELGAGTSARVIQIVKTMNKDTASGTLDSKQFRSQLAEIERVNPTRLPVIRGDGRIELLPTGYFAERRIFTLEDGVTYDETMTKPRASAVVDDLLGEFCFHDDGRSKSVAVAAMLTVFCACMLNKESARPAFIATANDSDAGKTLLAKAIIVPILGYIFGRAMPRHEETRKVLDQIAMEARTVVLFDNVKGVLGGEDLEAFISLPQWSGRKMGGQDGFEVDNVTTCFFSGNDCKPTRDMQQRSLFMELFLAEIDSTERKIKRELDVPVLREPKLRSEVCSALWTMVKQWDADGRPKSPSIMPKCPEWSRVIASIVVHAGYGDPCAKPNIDSARGDVAEMHSLIKVLAPGVDAENRPRAFEDWNFAEIISEVQREGLFANLELRTKKGEPEAVFDAEGEPTMAGRSYFGRLFTKFHTRLFTGKEGERLRFLVEGKGNTRKYRVVNEDVKAAAGSGEGVSSPASEASLDQ